MGAIQLLQCWVLAHIQTGQLVIVARQKRQFSILAHIQTGQLIIENCQILQFCILAHIQTGQLVFLATQLLQFGILAHIQFRQLVTVAPQFRQYCILAHIQTGQIVIGAIQVLQVGKELNAKQVTDVLALDIDLSDLVPLFRRQSAVVVCVKPFDIIQKRFVREDKIGYIDGAVNIRSCKGAEGQEGEYHCQRQKGTDKARSG